MSERRAAQVYDAVVRKVMFQEEQPNVRIELKTVPRWHWEASWIRGDGTRAYKVHEELSGLIGILDGIDWAEERPQPPAGPEGA